MSHPVSEAFVRTMWRQEVPDLTDDEFAALRPVVQHERGHLGRLVAAYRAGIAAATPQPERIGGYPPCPGCFDLRAPIAIGWDTHPTPRVMYARCRCGTFYRIDNGDEYAPTMVPVEYAPADPEA